ncbi:MAG TPA: Ig-like domain repeat protein [Candidatus Aquilonibacter sp.]|nr:Ig-like domain repeat protein [Candidatus Aquilonibacter sp.]
MFTKSFTSLRRFTGHVLTLMLCCIPLSRGAAAQSAPAVSASYAMGLSHPTGWGTIQQTAIDTFGDWLIVDYPNAALYELPVGSTTVVTLAPPGSLGSVQGYQNPGIAIDSNNNLYIEANFNNCLLMFPYDSTTKTWDGLSTLSPSNPTTNVCPNAGGGTSPYIFAQYGLTVASASGKWQGYFQPWGIAVDKNNNLVIGAQNSTPFIFTLNVTGSGASAKPGTGQLIVDKMTKRPISVAVDPTGNIYFVEDGGLSGVYMVPAGETDLASDTDPSIVRVDPNLPSVTGVVTDKLGNLYISDSKEGVFLVPTSSGTPNTAGAIMLTSVPAQGEVSVDLSRDILYVPTTQTQSNGEADIAEVTFNAALLGSTATGTPASTSQTVLFSFNASTTPGSFVIDEAGAATPDFTVASSGTCKAGTTYAAQSSCTVNVTLNPHAAGSVAAKLLMLDSSGNVLASMDLSGLGTGSSIQIQPGAQTTIDSGLMTPTQVAVDAAGNTYVADTGFTAVQMFAKGSSTATAVGTGLTSPTGVAVDGAGDVFIADSGSGSVVEIPNGPNGLLTANQTTLKTGLGSNLRLAADGVGDLYIADPSNNRVVKLSNVGVAIGDYAQTETDLTGFNAPSALAVDSSNNLYVADGSNLIEVTPAGVQTTLLTSLSGGTTGIAVDPSGAIYVAQTGGTIRIPNESGTLNPADQTTVATNVTSPASVALDAQQNLYIADGTAKDVLFISDNASINFGTLSSTTATASSTFTILDDGNAALNITGFTGTADYAGASTNCSGAPIASGTTCAVTVTFAPGPGDQGTLAGNVVVQSDASNPPNEISATGVGPALAASTTKITVSNPTVNGAATAVTVTPTSGTTPTPTGTVTLTVTGNGITPLTLSGTLSNGTVTLTPTNLAAGTYQFAVKYIGDRVYAGSTATTSVTVAAGAVTLTQPSMSSVQQLNPYYPYVLSNASGAAEPYDGSVSQYETTAYYVVKVAATDGQPLIGQPILDPTGKVVGENYGSVTFQNASTSTCLPIPVASDGTAQFDPSCLTIDTSNNSIPNIETSYTVTPMYSPAGAGGGAGLTNPNYTSVAGTAISYTALRNPMVSISSNPSSITVSKGSSATATLTLTSILGYGIAGSNGLLNNYELPVQLTCDGLPAYATCTFVYPNPDPTDPNSTHVGPATGTVLSYQGGTAAPCTVAQGCTGPATVIMTITTNAPTGVAMLERGGGSTALAAMFGMGLLSFGFSKRKALRVRLMTLGCVMLCFGLLGGLGGCSTTQLGANASQVTPSGTYTVQVTAKQVGSQVITQYPGITYGNENQMSLPFTMKVTVQ